MTDKKGKNGHTTTAPAPGTAIATTEEPGKNLPAIVLPKGMEGAFKPEEWAAMSPIDQAGAIEFFKQESEATTQGVAVTFPRWKFPTSGSTRFTMDTADGLLEEKELRGVVVFKLPRRAYYPPDTPAASKTPPACSSMDTIKPDVVPSPVSQASTCASCKFAQWGSGKNGRGQACKLRLQTFFLADGKPIPEYISLPPTALRTFSQYAVQLRQIGVPLVAVDTVFGLAKEANKDGVEYSGLTLKVGGKLPFAMAKAARDVASTFERHMRSMGIGVDEVAEDDAHDTPAGAEVVDVTATSTVKVDTKAGF